MTMGSTTERRTASVRVTVRRTGASALRDALTFAAPPLRRQVSVTNHYATFHVATPAAALELLDRLRAPLGVARGRVGHPYASLHAVRWRLRELEET